MAAIARTTPRRTDYVLLGTAALLTIIGLVIVWSASFVIGIVRFGDPNAYLIRHLLGAFVGIFLMAAAWRMDYHRLRFLALPIMILTIISLVAVLLFAIAGMLLAGIV